MKSRKTTSETPRCYLITAKDCKFIKAGRMLEIYFDDLRLSDIMIEYALDLLEV